MTKTRKNKFLIMALLSIVAILCISFIVVQKSTVAFAESAQTLSNEDLTYTLNSDGTGYKVNAANKNLATVQIPSTHNGLEVVEVADNAFISCTKLKTAVVPSTVKRIGNSAFLNCSQLEHVVGFSEVEEIGNTAFGACPKLRNVVFPDSITSLGSMVMLNNPNDIYVRLTEDEMTAINANWSANRRGGKIYYGQDLACEPVNPEDKTEGYKVLPMQNISVAGDIEFKCSYTGSDGTIYPVVELDQYAFSCSTFDDFALTYDTRIPSDFSVNIRSGAFMSVTGNSISINVHATYSDDTVIGDSYQDFEENLSYSVFSGSSVTEINLPDEIKVIPNSMFAGCTNLTTINFTGRDVQTNHLSSNIVAIGSSAFDSCNSLSTLVIPSSVDRVGESVFKSWGTEQTISIEKIMPSSWWHDNWNNGNADIKYQTSKVYFNNGKGTNSVESVEAMYGHCLPKVQAPTPPAGYAFVGYYSAANGQGKQYYTSNMDGKEPWGENEINTNITVIYAHYVPDKFYIEFDWAYGAGIENRTYVMFGGNEYYKNEQLTAKFMPSDRPYRDGYIFDGYYTQEKDGIQYFDENMYCDQVYDDTSVTKLYAHWTPINYLVEFDRQGGQDGTGTSQYAIPYNELPEKTIVITAPIRKHYKFMGYFEQPNGAGTQFFSQIIDENTRAIEYINPWNVTRGGTVYAYWEAIEYNITYQGYYGDNPNKSVISLNDFTNGSYMFEEALLDGYLCKWEPSELTSENISDNMIVTASYEYRPLSKCYNESTKQYEIWNIGQLDELRSFSTENRTFKLKNSIDLQAITLFEDKMLMPETLKRDNKDGLLWTPIPNFKGTLLGQNLEISGLKIYKNIGGSFGLFEYIDLAGEIRNLKVSGVIHVDAGIGDPVSAGLLCGVNMGHIFYCQSGVDRLSSLYIYRSNSVVGGLVGSNGRSIIGCTNFANIFGCGDIGGIVGESKGTLSGISSCANAGKIEYYWLGGNRSIGGIVGLVESGSLSGNTNTGDIYYTNSYISDSTLKPRIGLTVGSITTVS